jgi:GTP-binding protein
LHIVDITPLESDPAQDVIHIVHELEQYDPALAAQERWLVFNKIDTLPPEEQEQHCQAILQQLNWQEPAFLVSALTGQGCQEVCYKIIQHLEKQKALPVSPVHS